jgi:hypothetical protein
MNYVLHQQGSTYPLTLILVRCDQLVRAPHSHATIVHCDLKIVLYNFLTVFFPLNCVIAKTRKVKSRITSDACIDEGECAVLIERQGKAEELRQQPVPLPLCQPLSSHRTVSTTLQLYKRNR